MASASERVRAAPPGFGGQRFLSLPTTPPPAHKLPLAWGKMGNNQEQIAAPPLPAAHKWEGEVPRALEGRSVAVSRQRPADGCEAEMMHTDSAVPVSVPLKDRLRASAAPRVAEDAFFAKAFW